MDYEKNNVLISSDKRRRSRLLPARVGAACRWGAGLGNGPLPKLIGSNVDRIRTDARRWTGGQCAGRPVLAGERLGARSPVRSGADGGVAGFLGRPRLWAVRPGPFNFSGFFTPDPAHWQLQSTKEGTSYSLSKDQARFGFYLWTRLVDAPNQRAHFFFHYIWTQRDHNAWWHKIIWKNPWLIWYHLSSYPNKDASKKTRSLK